MSLFTTAATQTRSKLTLQGNTMGTQWSVMLASGVPQALDTTLHQLIESRLSGLCNEMSHWQHDSLLSKINGADTGWYALPPDFYTVLATAIQVARLSEGNYDPTLGELADLWGFGPVPVKPGQIPPTPARIKQAMHRCGWQQTQLNSDHCAVWQPGGIAFDFSSIAKGYAVDCMARLLIENGINDFLVEIGGELRACGVNDRGAPWQLAIETPCRDTTAPMARRLPISLNNLAIATSGNYRRVLPGQYSRYWHTLSPFTGRPVEHTLASVSVLHRKCMMADALATALLVMGPEKGLAFARKHTIAAVFMRDEGDNSKIFWTPEFERWAC